MGAVAEPAKKIMERKKYLINPTCNSIITIQTFKNLLTKIKYDKVKSNKEKVDNSATKKGRVSMLKS